MLKDLCPLVCLKYDMPACLRSLNNNKKGVEDGLINQITD